MYSRVLNTPISDAYIEPIQISLIEIFYEDSYRVCLSVFYIRLKSLPVHSQYWYYRETLEIVSAPSEVFYEICLEKVIVKGIVKKAEPCNCDIILASRIL